MSLVTPEIRDKLTVLYAHPSRHYHNLTHVTALLTLLSTYRGSFTDPSAVEAAIWFHDAIYHAPAPKSQNEIQSAELAVSSLGGSVEPDRLERIRVMIEATATHVPPSHAQLKVGKEAGEVLDARMFLDMDLGILGAEVPEFDEYEAGVRREYAHVDDDGWRTGRGAVLESFLGRERIYYTDLFGGLFEDRARVNLRRALGKLGGPQDSEAGTSEAGRDAGGAPGETE